MGGGHSPLYRSRSDQRCGNGREKGQRMNSNDDFGFWDDERDRSHVPGQPVVDRVRGRGGAAWVAQSQRPDPPAAARPATAEPDDAPARRPVRDRARRHADRLRRAWLRLDRGSCKLRPPMQPHPTTASVSVSRGCSRRSRSGGRADRCACQRACQTRRRRLLLRRSWRRRGRRPGRRGGAGCRRGIACRRGTGR